MAAISENQKVIYQFLGRSGLKVANLGLGAMTFGENGILPNGCNEEISHQILNRYVEWGGNFIDTADVYAAGQSEEYIGTWLEKQPREKYVIATKCGMDFRQDKSGNINADGLNRRHIVASLAASLDRLKTNYIDLYQCHLWDNTTPIEETLSTMNDLVRIGKIRCLGFSNVSGWQMQKIVDTAKDIGAPAIVSLQQQYNLLERDSEMEAFQVCKLEGIGVLPWSPLKGGLLSGKYNRGEFPTTGRVGWATQDDKNVYPCAPSLSHVGESTFKILDAMKTIAKKHGRTVSRVALRWLLQKDIVSSVIIGARTLEQLDDNMGAANGWSLSEEDMKTLDDLSSMPLRYPYEMAYGWNNRVNPYLRDQYVRSTF